MTRSPLRKSDVAGKITNAFEARVLRTPRSPSPPRLGPRGRGCPKESIINHDRSGTGSSSTTFRLSSPLPTPHFYHRLFHSQLSDYPLSPLPHTLTLTHTTFGISTLPHNLLTHASLAITSLLIVTRSPSVPWRSPTLPHDAWAIASPTHPHDAWAIPLTAASR